MTEDDIARIAGNLGYLVSFYEVIGRKGDGRSTTYVRFQSRGRNRITRSFGRIEDVMKLDQEEFVMRIAERFAFRTDV